MFDLSKLFSSRNDNALLLAQIQEEIKEATQATEQQIHQMKQEMKQEMHQMMNEFYRKIDKRLEDQEDRLRDVEYAMRASYSSAADGGRPAESRYGYRGKALIERPEDRDELGLFF